MLGLMNRPNTDGQNDDVDLDEDFEGDDGDDGEGDGSSDDESKNQNGQGDDQKGKSSNFKALYKKVKEQERLIKELTAGQAPDKQKKGKDSKSDQSADLEARLFFIENPEAKEYKDSIAKIREEFGGKITLERALKLAQVETPKKSESYEDEDFENRGEQRSKSKKKVEDYTPEEALKLPREQQALWRAANGVNPRDWEKKFGKK